jgi:hypothetical protein
VSPLEAMTTAPRAVTTCAGELGEILGIVDSAIAAAAHLIRERKPAAASASSWTATRRR